ncbi:MAG: AMMECR1 domain-containing protein [Benjaminiella poitrasii]|nr:MAG: AMMECR1 domain-containing protein [Benjaminiella poitrasii]
MDLTQLKEGLATGTRSAEHYLQQFGSDVISALKKTVTVLAPEDEEQERRGESSTSTIDNTIKSSPRIYATRKDGLIAKMQMDENTYLKEPGFSKAHYEQEKKIFETFNASFNIEEYTEEIAQLLNDYQGLRDMMDKLIEQDEQKRQLIVKQQQEEAEADFKWDSDDEDNMTNNDFNESNEIADKTNVKEEEGNARTSTTSNHTEDTDDFSNISSTSTSPPLKSSTQTEDDWVKAEKKKSDEEDSDNHCEYCFNVLTAYLEKKPNPKPNFPNDSYPLFVTWHKKTGDGHYQLRGCIGNFKPMSLHEGLRKYALISALRDQRFKPITLSEVPSLTCAVSLLTNFEIADNYLDWEIGEHGIWIEFVQLDGQKETATYLPEVMSEQGWTKQEAIESLLRKGGFYGRITEEYCLNSITLTRYQSVKCELTFDGEVILHE